MTSARISSARGVLAEIAAFWSTNHAVDPPTSSAGGLASARRRWIRLLIGRRAVGAAGQHFDLPRAPSEVARRPGEARLGAGGDLRAVRERRDGGDPALGGARDHRDRL